MRVAIRSRLGRPLRLRRGETVRTVDRTPQNGTVVFTGDDLRPSG